MDGEREGIKNTEKSIWPAKDLEVDYRAQQDSAWGGSTLPLSLSHPILSPRLQHRGQSEERKKRKKERSKYLKP